MAKNTHKKIYKLYRKILTLTIQFVKFVTDKIITTNIKEKMDKSKAKASIEYSGKWMRLKIPTELHTNIKIDSFKDNVNLDVKVLEYLQLGYSTAQKTREKLSA